MLTSMVSSSALGHEHEWAVGAPHVSFTLNCRTSPSTSIAPWCLSGLKAEYLPGRRSVVALA
jgi:hypothetical protein